MEVDGDIFDYLPSVLKKYMIYHCRVYTNAKTSSDFILTGGRNAVLYEIQGKQIISSFNLNSSIFKDLTLPNSMPADDTLVISVNIYFSYKKKTKEEFLFFRIGDRLAILGRMDKQLTVYREFRGIDDYEINDVNCTGEPNVEIIYQNGPSECIELASLSYSKKGIDIRCTSHGNQQFDIITRTLQERVLKASSILAETDIQIQKELHEYRKFCQTIDQNSNDNINILSRYGDYWVRNVNGHILIGIPVYNCTTSKNVVEKIRTVVFASNRTQLVYTHQLYGFQTENESIEPLKLRAFYERGDEYEFEGNTSDVKQPDLVFNHEWIHQKEYALLPDNAAVIIIKMDLKEFEMASNGCEFNIFAIYDVFLETGVWKELQSHIAAVKIDTDILHDSRYAVSFDSNCLFRDFLAVIATTERQMFRIELGDDVLMSQFHDLLKRNLSFDNIATTVDVDDEFKFSLSQNVNQTTLGNWTDEDHQLFYCHQDGYWNGTMIRIRTIKKDSADVYEMKIYNRDEIKIKNLLATFRNEFGRKIVIEPINYSNRTDLGLRLKYQFREELNALEDLAHNIKHKTNDVQQCYQKFLNAQHKTDTIWGELIKKKTN